MWYVKKSRTLSVKISASINDMSQKLYVSLTRFHLLKLREPSRESQVHIQRFQLRDWVRADGWVVRVDGWAVWTGSP
jgi:hypothetical protein